MNSNVSGSGAAADDDGDDVKKIESHADRQTDSQTER